MDALLLSLSNVTGQLLPIIGAVALVFLCIVLRKVWILVEELTKTVQNLDPTIKGIEKSIDKVQAPLDSAVKLTKSIDDLSEKTSTGFSKASNIAEENAGKAKSYLLEQIERFKKAFNEKSSTTTKNDPFERRAETYASDIAKIEEKIEEEVKENE